MKDHYSFKTHMLMVSEWNLDCQVCDKNIALLKFYDVYNGNKQFLKEKSLTFLSLRIEYLIRHRPHRKHRVYSKCHVTSNKANNNLECAEDKFQTRGWVQGCEKRKAASRRPE
jgi:hypothetical protein